MAIPPLNGNDIGVFAWYEHGLAFTDGEYADLHAQLSGKSSESPDEYYDGTYTYTAPTNGIFSAIVYSVRIRKDGYILAWLSVGTGAVYDFNFSGDSPLSQRAVQEIMTNAGVSGFAFAKCYYYNFNHPGATYVRWFGKNHRSTSASSYFYFTPPSDLTYHYVVLKQYLRYETTTHNFPKVCVTNIQPLMVIDSQNTVELIVRNGLWVYWAEIKVNGTTTCQCNNYHSYSNRWKIVWAVAVFFVS